VAIGGPVHPRRRALLPHSSLGGGHAQTRNTSPPTTGGRPSSRPSVSLASTPALPPKVTRDPRRIPQHQDASRQTPAAVVSSLQLCLTSPSAALRQVGSGRRFPYPRCRSRWWLLLEGAGKADRAIEALSLAPAEDDR
jgi:hypothetical protein